MLIYIFENDCQDSLVVLWCLTCLEKDLLVACLWQAVPQRDLLYCLGFFLFSLPQYFTAQWEDKCNYSSWSMGRRTPSCRGKHWADHHFLQKSKMTLPAAVSYFTRLTQKCAMYWVIHTASCSACFPSSPSLSSSLLANFHSNYQAGLFLPTLRWDESLKESWP